MGCYAIDVRALEVNHDEDDCGDTSFSLLHLYMNMIRISKFFHIDEP